MLIYFWPFYSFRKVSTGFTKAAFKLANEIVQIAISRVNSMPNKKGPDKYRQGLITNFIK